MINIKIKTDQISSDLPGAGNGNRTRDSSLGRTRLTTKLYPR